MDLTSIITVVSLTVTGIAMAATMWRIVCHLNNSPSLCGIRHPNTTR